MSFLSWGYRIPIIGNVLGLARSSYRYFYPTVPADTKLLTLANVANTAIITFSAATLLNPMMNIAMYRVIARIGVRYGWGVARWLILAVV